MTSLYSRRLCYSSIRSVHFPASDRPPNIADQKAAESMQFSTNSSSSCNGSISVSRRSGNSIRVKLYLPSKVWYVEMLCVERNLRSNGGSSWVFAMEATVKSEAVMVIGPMTTVSLGNARTSMQHYCFPQIAGCNVRTYQCYAEHAWTS